MPGPMSIARAIPVLMFSAFLSTAAVALQVDGATGKPGDDAAYTSEQLPRVILRVNRNLEVQGHVELEDDNVIVVRTPRGKLESFAKVRVLQIVRLVDPEPNQRGVVYMLNGQTRAGVILEDSFSHVTIEVEGILARLRRETVDFVVLEPTLDQRYREFKAAIGPRMHEQHLQLCQWLFDNRAYELALEELNELINNTDRDIPDAHRLRRLTQAQIELRSTAASPEAGGDVQSDEIPEEPSDRGRLLTREEVNLMRVFEIDFDNPPRVSVNRETIRKMIEKYSTTAVIPTTQAERNALFRADPLDIVRMLFKLRARELYGEVEVQSEPYSMNIFRQRVHNGWLLQNCATSACHGGPDAGALMLHRAGYQSELVRYTNFLILEKLDVHPEHRLIDYEDPEMSLLIQYGLPRDAARLPHPDVRGWKPVFTGSTERMRQDAIRWIKSMMQPRPEYPFEFEPPRTRKTERAEELIEDHEEGGRVPR
jgi:hypothetical protein